MPYGVPGTNRSGLGSASDAAFSIFKHPYASPPLHEEALLKANRTQIIRKRDAAGETRKQLVRAFRISFQSVTELSISGIIDLGKLAPR